MISIFYGKHRNDLTSCVAGQSAAHFAPSQGVGMTMTLGDDHG